MLNKSIKLEIKHTKQIETDYNQRLAQSFLAYLICIFTLMAVLIGACYNENVNKSLTQKLKQDTKVFLPINQLKCFGP